MFDVIVFTIVLYCCLHARRVLCEANNNYGNIRIKNLRVMNVVVCSLLVKLINILYNRRQTSMLVRFLVTQSIVRIRLRVS